MENILVATSNITCLYPINVCIFNKDYVTAYCIIFVAFFSYWSHLVENHKHNMPGIGVNKKMSYILNRFDVFGCLIVIVRMLYLQYYVYGLDITPIINNWKIVIMLIFLCEILGISETDVHNIRLKYRYIALHSIWHLGIFTLMGYYLDTVIYL